MRTHPDLAHALVLTEEAARHLHSLVLDAKPSSLRSALVIERSIKRSARLNADLVALRAQLESEKSL